jgi:hypothetical protein
MRRRLALLALAGALVETASAFLVGPSALYKRSDRSIVLLPAGEIPPAPAGALSSTQSSSPEAMGSKAGSARRAAVHLHRRGVARQATTRMSSEDLEGSLGLGFDFGTSGARINVVDADTLKVVHEGAYAYSEQVRASFHSGAGAWRKSGPRAPNAARAAQTADVWLAAMEELFAGIPAATKSKIARVAVSGTSASSLIVDARDGATVTRGPRMYDFSVAPPALDAIARAAPEGHTVRSSTSALAKLIDWHRDVPLAGTRPPPPRTLAPRAAAAADARGAQGTRCSPTRPTSWRGNSRAQGAAAAQGRRPTGTTR